MWLLLPSLAVSSVLVAVDPDDAVDTGTRLRTLGAHTVTTDNQDADVSVVIAWFSDATRAADVARELRSADEAAVATVELQ